MIYYRIAFQGEYSPGWQWKSTILISLNSVFAFLNVYRVFPKDRTRIFFASRTLLLDQMLARENAGLVSNSIRTDHLLHGRQAIHRLEMQRMETELLVSVNREVATLNPEPVHARHGAESLKASSFSTDSLAQEREPGSDHEIPYHFAAADSWPQALAWIKLLAKVHRGELEP